MGRNLFVFKPPYFPKYDSIAPSIIFEGNSRKLDYTRWTLRCTVSLMLFISCLIFSLSIYARIVFGRSVHSCMGTLGEINNSNDRSVTVVIPQITIGMFILTFVILINGYNLLIQFLIVLTILESVTLIVWRYQLPHGNIELDYTTYFVTVTKRMLRCYEVNNITDSLRPCWQVFMADNCPEWMSTESFLCFNSAKLHNDTGDTVDKNKKEIDTSDNLMTCYDRFLEHPWTNTSREEVYMNSVSPQTTMLLVVHATAVLVMYIMARVYVYEFSRLRTKWIEELQKYHVELTSSKLYQEPSPDNDFRMMGSIMLHKQLVWDINKCDVCKEEMSSSHCWDWLVNPEEESFPVLSTAQQDEEMQQSYYNINDAPV